VRAILRASLAALAQQVVRSSLPRRPVVLTKGSSSYSIMSTTIKMTIRIQIPILI
jgi:hypothetical protein